MSVENAEWRTGTLTETLLQPAFQAGYDDGWHQRPFRYPKPKPGDEYCDVEWSYERGRHFAAYLKGEGYSVQIPIAVRDGVWWVTHRAARAAFRTRALV